jgi:hypothetical protein
MKAAGKGGVSFGPRLPREAVNGCTHLKLLLSLGFLSLYGSAVMRRVRRLVLRS